MEARRLARWILTLIAGLGLLCPRDARAGDGTNCAVFKDWQAFGCQMTPGGAGALPSEVANAGGNQAHCVPCEGSGGMARWWVDEPYIGLWVVDEPLSYATSSGQRMAFRWTHRQRSRLPDALRFREVTGAGRTLGQTMVPIRLREQMLPGSGVTIMTNAVWCHNWWSEIVFWDTNFEATAHSPTVDSYYGTNRAYYPFSLYYQGLVFTGEGGMIWFDGSSASAPNGAAQVRVEILGHTTASGGPEVPVRTWQYPPPYPTSGTIWVDDPHYGFRLVYPDGSQDEYGFVLYVGGHPWPPIQYEYTARAYLTRRIDPAGRVTRLGYDNVLPRNGDPTQPAYVVRYVVDSDGRTNTYTYNANSDRLVQVQDAYGRTAGLGYDGNSMLASITDAMQMVSSFQYQPGVANSHNGWLTNLTTPYGTTTFTCADATDGSTPDGYLQRAVLVSEPTGAHQLYCYRHQSQGLVAGIATNAPTVPGAHFDTGSNGSNAPELYYRNSFYWDRGQCDRLPGSFYYWLQWPHASLSAALNTLAATNYQCARLKHWLLGSDGGSVTGTLSSERDPSPDLAGQTEGGRTWYDHPGKDAANPHIEGASPLASCVARALPDGTTNYVCLDYGIPLGYYPARRWETYTASNGAVALRTNWYRYSANGVDLVSVTNSLGQWVNLRYNTNHQAIGLTNTLNQAAGLVWDSMTLNLREVSLPGGQSVGLTYYDPAHPPGWPLGSSNSLLRSVTLQPQNLTTQIKAYTYGLPRVVQRSGTGLPPLTVTHSWDGLNRLTGTVFPDGTSVSNVYDRLYLGARKDRLGNWTGYGYDALEHLTSITDSLSNTTLFGWCECGGLTSITDALTNSTVLNYNNQGLVTNILFADGSSLNYSLDAMGRVTRVADGLGKALTYGYNNQGLVTTVSNAYGLVERVVYDAVDRPIQVTDANSVTVTNQFDLLNRLTARIWQDGKGEGFGWATNGLAAYTNRNGKATRFTRDGAGRLTGVTNADLEITALRYNSLNQVTDLWDGRTNHTGWSYNEYGWLYSKVDAQSRDVLRLGRNANGQVTNRWTPQFGDTTYVRDANGNVTSIQYPGSSISFAYDPLNRLQSMTDAVGTSGFGYTAAGQLQSENGPWSNDTLTYGYTQGQRTSMTLGSLGFGYDHDSAWRLQTLTSPAGTFGYDYTVGQSVSPAPLVRAITLPNSASIINHYDSLSRLDYTALLNQWGHVLDGYGYTHDLLGLRTNIVRDLGLTSSTVSIGYDHTDQITSWSSRETSGVLRQNEQCTYTWDKAGNLRLLGKGNLTETFGCDVLNQITNITRSGTLTVSGATPVPAVSVTVNGQLAQTNGDFTFACTNFTLTNGQNTFTIIAQNAAGLRVTNTTTENLPAAILLTWDSNGNLTSDGTRFFAYDPENRLLTNWVVGAWKTEFVYDGLGRRRIERDYGWSSAIADWQLTNETRYMYDGWLLVQERDASNNALVTYTRGLDLSGTLAGAGGIGGLLASTDGSRSTFYHADGAGNVTGMIDEQGNMAARYMYSAFGKLAGKWGPMADANEMQFSSMPTHRLSGLSLYPFRAYDPSLQRWLSRDPLGEWGDMNLYRGTFNSPLNVVDRSGRDNYLPGGENSTAGLSFSLLLPAPVPTPPSIGPALGNAVPFNQNQMPSPFTYNALLTGAPHLVDTPLGYDLGQLNAELINSALIPAVGGSLLKAPSLVSKCPRGSLKGSLDGLTAAERNFVNEMLANSKNVEIIPRGVGKTADFLIDGANTELKTLTTAGPNTLKNAIERASFQGKEIVIDARNVAITPEAAAAQIQRAQGNIGALQGRVTVLTSGGVVTF